MRFIFILFVYYLNILLINSTPSSVLIETGKINGKLLILFLCSQVWASDYMYDIFSHPKYEITNYGIDYLNYVDESYHNNSNKMQGLNLRIPQIVIFSVIDRLDGTYPDVRRAIELFKPIVLIHLDDEYQNQERGMDFDAFLYDKVPLVLRQYGVYPYRTYKHPLTNVHQIPLGYK